MVELLWAWRVWFGQIAPNDVPLEIRPDVLHLVKELEKNE